MILFPCGTINSSDSTGTLNHVTYRMFEPNENSSSKKVFYNLLSSYETQILSTRQKAEPSLSIIYTYKDIFNKEFQQIKHFVSHRSAELNSFYTTDWENGFTPSTVASVAGNWQVVGDSTLDYSATSNMKSNYIMLWDGNKFRVGDVTVINSATRLTMNPSYGNLSLSDAQSDANAYPIYEVRFSENPLKNFEPSVFIGGTLSNTEFAGYMHSGTVSFISKYKV